MKRLRRLEVNLFYLWHSRTHLARSHRIIHPDGPTNCRLPLCRSSFREYIWSIQTDGGRPRSKNWGALSTWRRSWNEADLVPGKVSGTSPCNPCQRHCLLPSHVGNRNSSQLFKARFNEYVKECMNHTNKPCRL